MAPTAANLEGLIAACDRALAALRDPARPEPIDRVMTAHVEHVRALAEQQLAALGNG